MSYIKNCEWLLDVGGSEVDLGKSGMRGGWGGARGGQNRSKNYIIKGLYSCKNIGYSHRYYYHTTPNAASSLYIYISARLSDIQSNDRYKIISNLSQYLIHSSISL